MKILFLTRLFYPHIGGVETHVREISRLMAEDGHKITIVAEELPKTYSVSNHSRGESARMVGIEKNTKIYRILASEGFWKKFKIWWWIWLNKKLIKEADIIHCHDVFFWYLPFRFLFPTKKIFTTFHGYETKFPPSKKAVLIRKLSEKLSMGNICVGDFIKKWYGTKPTYVTYGGVEENGKIDQNYKASNNTYKIVYIGRFDEDSGIITYLEALKTLSEKNTKIRFEAFGDGPKKQKIRKFGEVHGYVHNLYSYTKNVQIAFCSSYLTILSLLSKKILVVSTYNSPIKKDYLLMSPFSKYIVITPTSEELVKRVELFFRDPNQFTNLIEKGYFWSKSQTWRKVVDLYYKLWKI